MRTFSFLSCIVFVVSLTVSSSVFAQKQKVEITKEDICTADGTPVFKLFKTPSNTIPGYKDAILADLAGHKLAIFQTNELPNPAMSTGKEPYYEVTFLATGAKCEIRWFMKMEKLAENILEAGLVKNGELDDQAAQEFIIINGTKYTQRRNAMNPQPQTIIIQQQPAPQPAAPQPGVNINVRIPR